MQAYIYIVKMYGVSFSYYFHFHLFVSKSNMKFCNKNFLSPIVSHDYWTWKFGILASRACKL